MDGCHWMDGGGLHDNLVCAVPGARYRIKIGKVTRDSKLFRNRRPCLGIAVRYRNRSRRAFTLLKIDFKRFKTQKRGHKHNQNWKSSGMTVKVPDARMQTEDVPRNLDYAPGWFDIAAQNRPRVYHRVAYRLVVRRR